MTMRPASRWALGCLVPVALILAACSSGGDSGDSGGSSATPAASSTGPATAGPATAGSVATVTAVVPTGLDGATESSATTESTAGPMSTTPEGSAPAVAEDPIETPADQPAAPALAGAAAVASGYTSEIREVDANLAARMATSWRDGCPVPLADLRYVVVSYRGFDGADHTGELVVAASVAGTVTEVFRDLYDSGYPIASMRLVDDFGGSDDASMAANNTSAFNCRPVTGGGGFSEHSYGTAIDLNPVQNPYLSGSLVLPEQGRDYLSRQPAPGVIQAGDAVVSAFANRGWTWGGTWSGPIDYQHFSVSGR